jgi:hypothetical protein
MKNSNETIDDDTHGLLPLVVNDEYLPRDVGGIFRPYLAIVKTFWLNACVVEFNGNIIGVP